MSDDALRAFERALASGDSAEVLRLAPAILARARATPDLTAAERERVALEERKRIGERLAGLESLGLERLAGLHGLELAGRLMRGEEVPDPETATLRVLDGEAVMLVAPLREIGQGINARPFDLIPAVVEDRLGARWRQFRREVLLSGHVVWSRDPAPPETLYPREPFGPLPPDLLSLSFFQVPPGPNPPPALRLSSDGALEVNPEREVSPPRLVCLSCGADLFFSARQRGDGLCGPCSRRRVEHLPRVGGAGECDPLCQAQPPHLAPSRTLDWE